MYTMILYSRSSMATLCHSSLALILLLLAVAPVACHAQSLPRRQNDAVPAQVETIYNQGLRYLAKTQNANGSWGSASGARPGVVGLCILAFLAYGEDPNHGPYAKNISKALDFIIKQHQQGQDGYMGPQMYDHGFATLALAECYGMVDDKRIAPALKKCVDLILEAQKKNPRHGWRYKPDTKSADTTVSGCQLVALLAARNAGIPVPDAAIEKGLGYMSRCRSGNGAYGYSSKGGGRITLSAIGSLCFSLAKKRMRPDMKRRPNTSVAISMCRRAPILFTSATTCPRHFSKPMRSCGKNGTRTTYACYPIFNYKTDPLPATTAMHTVPLRLYSPWHSIIAFYPSTRNEEPHCHYLNRDFLPRLHGEPDCARRRCSFIGRS